MTDIFCDPMDGSPPGSSVHGISQARIVDPLFQGIFSTQRLNLCLLSWQADSLLLSHQGSPMCVCVCVCVTLLYSRN